MMLPRWIRSPAVLFFVVMGLLPLLPAPPFWYTMGNYIGVAAVAVIGLVLLTGVAGMTSFGQAAFVGLGAYATAVLCTAQGWSPWLGLLAGLLLSGGSAALIGAITVRLSGHFLPLATIAWALSLYYLFGTVELLGKYDGLSGIPPISLLGFELDTPRSMFALIWLAVLLCVVLTRNLLDSRAGRTIRALHGGAVMAEAMGANTARYKLASFICAALMASVAGWLYAHLQRSVSAAPFGLNVGIEYLFMAVIGGVAHVWGAIIGAGVLLLLKAVLQDWLPQLLGSVGSFETVAFGVIIILVLQRSSRGLWPVLLRLFKQDGVGQEDGQENGKKSGARAPAVEPAGFAAMPVRAKPARGECILQVRRARKQFGGLVAVNDMEFELHAGEIVGLIGPNGAGKSTMFNLITGVLPVTSGEIFYQGQRIDSRNSREIVRRGVARTFQHVRLMPEMSVLENVAIGAYLRGRSGMLSAALRTNRDEEARLLHLAAEQLRRVGMGELMYQAAGSLALGQQRILEIARALCTDPALLLLDEPAAGLRLKEKQALATLLSQLRAEGMAVLIVEHDMDFVMGLTDRLVVMEFGTRIAQGKPAEIRQDPAVLRAYLGGVELA